MESYTRVDSASMEFNSSGCPMLSDRKISYVDGK